MTFSAQHRAAVHQGTAQSGRVISLVGFIVEGLIIATVFVDTIFAIPGYGSIAGAAFSSFDYPVIMGTTLLYGMFLLVANLFVDITYAWLDPRIRYE